MLNLISELIINYFFINFINKNYFFYILLFLINIFNFYIKDFFLKYNLIILILLFFKYFYFILNIFYIFNIIYLILFLINIFLFLIFLIKKKNINIILIKIINKIIFYFFFMYVFIEFFKNKIYNINFFFLSNIFEVFLLLLFIINIIDICIYYLMNFFYLNFFFLILKFFIFFYSNFFFLKHNSINKELKSSFLKIHVILIIISYSGFIISSISNILFFFVKKNKIIFKKIFFRINYISFLLFSLGFFIGSLWAKKSWGNYWNNDIKEIFSLLLWINYLLLIHLFKYLNDFFLLIWSIINLFIIWLLFLGINYNFNSLHNY